MAAAHSDVALAKLAGGLLIPANPRRIGLQIFAPLANRITLSQSQTPVLDQGPTLYPLGFPLQMDIAGYGQAVTGAWYAIAAVADQPVGYIETIYPFDTAPQ